MSDEYECLYSEKQETKRSTIDTFEEIYSNIDISSEQELDPYTGVQFLYPTRWLEWPSQNKKIAFRRFDITPSYYK